MNLDWIEQRSLELIKQKQRKTKELQNELNLDYNNLYTRLKRLEKKGLIEMEIENRKAIWIPNKN